MGLCRASFPNSRTALAVYEASIMSIWHGGAIRTFPARVGLDFAATVDGRGLFGVAQLGRQQRQMDGRQKENLEANAKHSVCRLKLVVIKSCR